MQMFGFAAHRDVIFQLTFAYAPFLIVALFSPSEEVIRDCLKASFTAKYRREA